MKIVQPPSLKTRKHLIAVAERRLTPHEVREALAIPLTDSEREESLSLIRWFRRRYPHRRRTPRLRAASLPPLVCRPRSVETTL